MAVYYNEHDPKKAAWLRELIRVGVIAPGDVDERSIVDVRADELRGYAQCHFFAGIGVWSYALRLAGWSDERPVWTASCPCQPFSAAGKRKGKADDRHLWPVLAGLVREARPVVALGEQVASKDGLAWLDDVFTDLEAAAYTTGAVDSCAAGYGAPHIRQRLYWMAYSDSQRCDWQRLPILAGKSRQEGFEVERSGEVVRMGNSAAEGLPLRTGEAVSRGRTCGEFERSGDARFVGNAHEARLQGQFQRRNGANECATGTPSVVGGFWQDADWIACRDGKARPVEPGTFPLAHVAPARVVRLRGYGDAIVASQAAEFIKAVMEEIG